MSTAPVRHIANLWHAALPRDMIAERNFSTRHEHDQFISQLLRFTLITEKNNKQHVEQEEQEPSAGNIRGRHSEWVVEFDSFADSLVAHRIDAMFPNILGLIPAMLSRSLVATTSPALRHPKSKSKSAAREQQQQQQQHEQGPQPTLLRDEIVQDSHVAASILGAVLSGRNVLLSPTVKPLDATAAQGNNDEEEDDDDDESSQRGPHEFLLDIARATRAQRQLDVLVASALLFHVAHQPLLAADGIGPAVLVITTGVDRAAELTQLLDAQLGGGNQVQQLVVHDCCLCKCPPALDATRRPDIAIGTVQALTPLFASGFYSAQRISMVFVDGIDFLEHSFGHRKVGPSAEVDPPIASVHLEALLMPCFRDGGALGSGAAQFVATTRKAGCVADSVVVGESCSLVRSIVPLIGGELICVDHPRGDTAGVTLQEGPAVDESAQHHVFVWPLNVKREVGDILSRQHGGPISNSSSNSSPTTTPTNAPPMVYGLAQSSDTILASYQWSTDVVPEKESADDLLALYDDARRPRPHHAGGQGEKQRLRMRLGAKLAHVVHSSLASRFESDLCQTIPDAANRISNFDIFTIGDHATSVTEAVARGAAPNYSHCAGAVFAVPSKALRDKIVRALNGGAKIRDSLVFASTEAPSPSWFMSSRSSGSSSKSAPTLQELLSSRRNTNGGNNSSASSQLALVVRNAVRSVLDVWPLNSASSSSPQQKLTIERDIAHRMEELGEARVGRSILWWSKAPSTAFSAGANGTEARDCIQDVHQHQPQQPQQQQQLQQQESEEDDEDEAAAAAFKFHDEVRVAVELTNFCAAQRVLGSGFASPSLGRRAVAVHLVAGGDGDLQRLLRPQPGLDPDLDAGELYLSSIKMKMKQ